MGFEPVNFSRTSRGSANFVAIDKHKRLNLSRKAQRELGISDALYSWIVVYYDKATHRIAIQKNELVSNAPEYSTLKLDKRGTGSARSIVNMAAIDENRLPLRYFYDGKVSINGETFYSYKLAD